MAHPVAFIPLLIFLLLVQSPHLSYGFWWEDSGTVSGLNLDSGYDVNTVTQVTGKVTVIPYHHQEHVLLEIEHNGGRLLLALGPDEYWEQRSLPQLPVGTVISARGSKAQGKDGRMYLMVQQITDTSQGVSLVIRDETGTPVWAGGGHGARSNPTGASATRIRQRSGSGRRGR